MIVYFIPVVANIRILKSSSLQGLAKVA